MVTLTRVALLSGMAWSSAALACPGKSVDDAHASAVTTNEPSSPARSGKLIGSNCSYTTGVMARRVLADGEDYAYVGVLDAASNELDSGVAAPFKLGVDEATFVVATDLVERIVGDGLANAELSIQGKMLEVEGRRYVVLTSYRPLNT